MSPSNSTGGAPPDPHGGSGVVQRGSAPEAARAAMLLLHGRGATAEDILTLVPAFERPGIAYLAPQAAGFSWYPHRFLEPLERNEPHLSSALALIARLLARLQRAGVPAERTILLGFSQGACLATEFAARHARRYGAVVGLTGGLIGPDATPRDHPGALEGTPVFLGAGDPDPHVPWPRVEDTAAVLARLGGDVTLRRYPGIGHTVIDDEIDWVRRLVARVAGEP